MHLVFTHMDEAKDRSRISKENEQIEWTTG